MTERPELVTDEHLEYLDDLRKSGETNMYRAVPYLEGQFNLNKEDAKTVVGYWMRSFGERHS